MRIIRGALIALFAVALTAPAAINPKGIVNIASYRPQGLPNSAIAQGSLFAIFGSGLAQGGLAQATTFPLPTTLGGASVSVTVNGVTRACPLIYTTPGQMAVLLPSSVPVGTGTLTVTFSGSTFNEPIEVVRSSPGVFTQNQQGSGPAIFTNFISEANQPVNQIDQALAVNGVGTLWFTGLGPVAGDDAAGPLPGDLRGQFDVKVYVGGVQATEILYAGRSGCCAGLDQVVFRVPANAPTGCYIPVVVTVDGVPSNYSSVSVTDGGTVCSQGDLFTAADIEAYLADGNFSIGSVSLSKVEFDSGISFPAQGVGSSQEIATASFERFAAQNFRSASAPQEFLPVGGCMVFAFTGQGADFNEVVQSTPLDPGAITLSGPTLTSDPIPMEGPGEYFKNYSQPSFPGLPLQSTPVLTPGQYTFSATGGASVGSFNATRNFSGGINWTNAAQINAVNRGQGLTVTWTGGSDAEEYVFIFGASFNGIDLDLGFLEEEGGEGGGTEEDEAYGAAFWCQAPVSAGRFTVGPEVLGSLPPSLSISFPGGSFSTGSLQVGVSSKPREFKASGLDLGFFVYSQMKGKSVDYQ